MQDSAFIEKLRARDEAAFKQLFDLYAEKLFNLCYRFLCSRAEAEDALQEVMCKVYLSIAHFRADAQLSSWIYRIAVNYCLNVQRRQRRTRWLSLDQMTGKDHEEASAGEDTPQDRLERGETERIVQEAINKLSETQRTVLILYRYEGQSYQEIAQTLGCSLSAVESRLHQAKQNLSRVLLPLFGEK